MDDREHTRKSKPFALIAIILAAVALVSAVLVWLWRRRRARRMAPSPPPPPIRVRGLTEAEAEARRLEGQDNVIQVRPPRTRQEIWRDNVYNIFNLNLVGLAFAQLLLGRPLDSLLSLGTIGLNIGINIFQEMFSRRRLSEVELATRPRATVIRDDHVRSIDPSELVLGDALIIGPGDQVLVDGEVIGEGQIEVDESMLTGESGWQTKAAGDKVFAGSFCLSGRAACQVQTVGDERLIVTRMADAPAGKEELTPLQRVIDRVLRYLVVFVYLSTAFLLTQYFRLDLGVQTDVFNEVISIVFNIAPASLFLMIIVTYATGTADLGRLGALVYRAQSVESLAQATVICFAKAGILTGTYVEIETPKPQEEVEGEEEPGLAESRLRQVLGDYARTTSVDNLAIRGMADTFEGSWRAAAEEAPFLAVYGWSAVAFDDEDLRGVYVLAEPEVLEAHLAFQAERAEADEDRGALDTVRTAVAPVGRLFGRVRGLLPGSGEEDEEPAIEQPGGDQREQADVTAEPNRATEAAEGGLSGEEGQSLADRETSSEDTHSAEATQDDDEPRAGLFGQLGQRIGHALRRGDTTTEESGGSVSEGEPSQETEAQPGLFRRLALQVNRVLRRGETPAEDQESPAEEPPVHETVLAFAYHPDLVPLHDAAGQPHLPRGLIPLCTLRYTQRVRPEAVETIRTFSRTGVDIKVFAAGPPEQTAAMLQQAGLGGDEGGSSGDLGTISGVELEELDPDQFAAAASAHTVFGEVSPEQAGEVVAALRDSGEIVAAVGDAVADLPPLRQANLAISRQSSTQAALSVSDMVLLEDSPAVLSVVLQKGQRIVNGLLDVLKVNLTQVLYLAFLFVAIRLVAYGFPYRSGQGTVIAVATVALPSVGLSLGAAAGVLPSARLGRFLARFVVPAAMTIGATALVVYLIFLDRSGDVSYAQLGVMYTLVGCGLLLVVFIKPPWQPWYTGRAQAVAWWPVLMAAILFPAVVLVSAIPLAQDLLYVDLLREPEHYAVVGLAVLAWALVLRFVLWIMPVVGRR